MARFWTSLSSVRRWLHCNECLSRSFSIPKHITAFRVTVATGLAWLGFVSYLALVRQLPDVPLLGENAVRPVGHYGAFVIIGGLAYLLVTMHFGGAVHRQKAAIAALGSAMVLGIGLEGLQTLVPERDDVLSDLLFDLLFDAAGALTGVGAIFLLEQLRVSRASMSMAWAGASAVLIGLVSVAMVLWTPYIPSLADCGVLTPEPSGPATPSGVREVATARVDAAEVSRIEGRVNDGLVVLYDFSEGSGNVVRDISGVPTPLDLTILDPGKIQWLPESNGVRFTGAGTAIRSRAAASKIYEALTASGRFTLEVWLAPADLTQEGPVRIVTMSDGTREHQVNVHLGQQASQASFRLSTNCEYRHQTFVPQVFTDTLGPRNLAATYNGAEMRMFVDGVAKEQTGVLQGDFSIWNPSYPLSIGNELTLDRSYRGDIFLVAIYDRVLTEAEVRQNYSAGPQP